MAMQLTVTRNRKRSHNFNSEGYGVGVTVELDQRLLDRPAALRQRIDDLYREAEAALERQVEHAAGRPSGGSPGNGDGRHRAEGAGPATQRQRRAIDAIAEQLEIDVARECQAEFGLGPDELDAPTASRLIDHLKALQAGGDGRPRRVGSNGAHR